MDQCNICWSHASQIPGLYLQLGKADFFYFLFLFNVCWKVCKIDGWIDTIFVTCTSSSEWSVITVSLTCRHNETEERKAIPFHTEQIFYSEQITMKYLKHVHAMFENFFKLQRIQIVSVCCLFSGTDFVGCNCSSSLKGPGAPVSLFIQTLIMNYKRKFEFLSKWDE